MRDSRAYGPEQRCVRPGVWLIEGWQVTRHTGARALSWKTEWHVARSPSGKPVIVRTLAEAREWIMGEGEGTG